MVDTQDMMIVTMMVQIRFKNKGVYKMKKTKIKLSWKYPTQNYEKLKIYLEKIKKMRDDKINNS